MALFQSLLQRHGSEVAARGGSLFRFGNFDQPIDATNNVFDNFKDHATTEFDLAPLGVEKKGTWTEVAGKTQITNKPRASAGFSDRKQTINGNPNCHVAEYEDFHPCNSTASSHTAYFTTTNPPKPLST